MASKNSNSIAGYYDSAGNYHSLSGYPNRIKLIYSYAYNKDGKYTLSWEIQADSSKDTGGNWTYYYTASMKVGSKDAESLLDSKTGFKKGATIGKGTAQVTQGTTCRLVAKSYIAQNAADNLATITVDVAIPAMPYLKVQYYSNYATSAFDGAENAVSASTNVIVRTAYFYRDQNYANGLHNYKDSGDGTYLARTGYTATGNWGSSTSGGTLLSESAGNKTGAALATHFGKNISSANATQKLYAQWTPKNLKISLDGNGGTLGSTKYTFLLYNTRWQNSNDEEITAIKEGPTRTGYVFTGFYTKTSGGTKIINANKTFVSGKLTFTSAATTLYAHWEESKLTLKHYANNATSGTLNGTNLTANELNNTAVCCPDQVIAYTEKPSSGLANTNNSSYLNLSRTGYATGKAWSASTNGSSPVSHDGLGYSGADYATAFGGNIANKHQTIKIYAVWNARTYTVTFNPQGGSVSPTSKTVTYNSTYGDLPTPSKTGHTFSGWYTATSGGTEITSSTKVSITAAQTLYARWTANTYTNKIDHYQQRDPGFDGANSNGWKKVATTTFDAVYGTPVTVPSNQIQTYTGHYNTGKANSESWDWKEKTIGSDSFTQPAGAITIQYFYNGYKLTVKYKTGKVDIGTNEGASLTSNELAGTSVFYTHSDSYGNEFNSGKGLMNYNNSDAIYLRKYGFRIPSGSEWKNVANNNTCTQDGDLTTQQIASNLGVSINSSNQTVTVEPNWQANNLVKIYDGSAWVDAVPMIFNGSDWVETIPYVYKNDTDKWKQCK